MPYLINSFALLLFIGFMARPSIQRELDQESWDKANPGEWYPDEYKAVNEHLMEEVDDSEAISTNVDSLFARMYSSQVDRREMVVLKKLTALKNTEGNCDEISYKILMDNDRATYYKSHDVTSKKSAPRRIDKIINFYAVQHAISCQKEIESLVKSKLELIDRDVLYRLSTWLDPMIADILAHFQTTKGQTFGNDYSSKVFHAIIKRGISDLAIGGGRYSYDAIKKFVQNNPDEEKYLHHNSNDTYSEAQFHQDEIRKLSAKYLEDSCKVYVGQVGSLFEKADYDAIFHHEVNPREMDYYRVWAYNTICTDIYVTDKLKSWQILNLLEYAKKFADA